MVRATVRQGPRTLRDHPRRETRRPRGAAAVEAYRPASEAWGAPGPLAPVRARVDLAARRLHRRPTALWTTHVGRVRAAPALHRRRRAARPLHVLRVVAVRALRRGARTVRTFPTLVRRLC